MARSNFNIPKAAGALALALMLSACSSDGNNRAELRKLAGVEATSPSPQIVLTDTPQPESTEPPVIVEVTRETVQQIEVTRIVEQPAQIIEVTVEVTATPDIAGFQDSGIDESIQPCPVKYWKRNRCVANDATVEAYANEVKP